jgi:hypothetical protein
MSYSLEDLTTPLTKEQVKQSIYDVMAALGTDTTTWKPGAVVRTMIAAVALVIAACTRLTASLARMGFLELAEGPWLTLVAHYLYGVDRIEATFATGEITLTNAAGGVYEYGVDEVVFLNSTTNKTFRNAEAISLGAMGTQTIAIVAVEAGSASTSSAGTIDEIETTLDGVTCSNANAVVGQDEEADPSLKSRCLEKTGSLSPFGPWDAYSYAARNAKRADGTFVGVTRPRSTRDGRGVVTTYVATATGEVTGSVGDTSTDLGAVNDAIQRYAAPLSITANVLSATAIAVPVTYQAWAYNTSGLTDVQIKALIAAKLTALMSTTPTGGNVINSDPGKVFASAVKTAIQSARPEIFRVDVSLPAGDVTLEPYEVPVLGTVLGTVSQVPSPTGFF